MTVCIAAICQRGAFIVGAADRMITTGNTEFEVPSISKERVNATVLKVVPLNRHVVAMISGDAGFQSEAVQYIWEKIADSRNNDPQTTFSSVKVREIGQHYIDFCNARRLQATNNLLAPYGLTSESFLAKQKSLTDQFIDLIVNEIERIRRNTGDEIIFSGIDDTSGHILVCDGSQWSSADSFGFAAIGSGSEHAASQFMLAEHTRDESLEDTALLTYIAKKRSEVSPGVGKQTDMFVIWGPGNYFLTHDNLLHLDAAYQRMEKVQKRALKSAKKEITAYVAKLRAETEKLMPQPQAKLRDGPATESPATQSSNEITSSSDQT